MKARFLLALILAFGSLLFANPAEASDWQVTNGLVRDGSVQFDYRGGTASQTLQAPEGSTLTITVNNTIANCIGACQPLPDTWSLTINGERWDGNSIDIMTIQTLVSGEVTITATGIDRGFWAGWYGPIISAPIITAPPTLPVGDYSIMEGGSVHLTAPTGQTIDRVSAWYGNPSDATQGADWSAQYTEQLHGLTEADLNSGNYFGDPVPGVVKVLIATVFYTQATSTDSTDTVEPSPQPTPAPVVEPTPTPSPESIITPIITQPAPIQPSPEPTPEPTPEPIPEPTPTATPETPQPTPQATTTPKPEPTPTATTPAKQPESQPEPSATPVSQTPHEEESKPLDKLAEIDPATLSPVEQAVITQQAFAVLATADQGSPAYEQALEALLVVAQADDPELPADLAAIPFVGDVAGAMLDTFNAVGNLGADISPKERARGQKIVVGTVIVGQMASVALLRR